MALLRLVPGVTLAEADSPIDDAVIDVPEAERPSEAEAEILFLKRFWLSLFLFLIRADRIGAIKGKICTTFCQGFVTYDFLR